ncbi:MAG: type VI secretion system protein TssA [Acidobacteriota bacterium]|nr:type VI secretion system protein TssA [Acidobacteriota bacterium]
MALRDDLLNPIPGDNPSGVSLRYERVYDQIKEARTEEDESIPSGEWQRAAKRADYVQVIKLAGEALATRSKDLQLAAWLAEAHVKREGLGLIHPCLQLFRDLQEQFWETLYPEIEDGDAGMRAVPIEWAANRIATILREAPITRDGLNFYQYRESRSVGYEADAESSDAKREARELAIADGKVTGEDFDKGVASTSKAWYAQLDQSIRSAAETLEELQIYSEEKYGDDGPGFGKLRSALEEVGQVIGSLLNEKRKLEPDEPAESGEEEPEAEPEPEEAAEAEEAVEAAPVRKAKPGKALSAEPADREDAMARVQACARFLQKDNTSSPIAYLLQSSLRFGELREQGSSPSWDFLVPPATDVRQNLKRLAAEWNWDELLSAAIAAVGEPCGRGWLDVHRYIWKAASELGHYAIAAGVTATLQALLKDLPEVASWTLSDDTPTANPETQRWLEEMVIPKPPEAAMTEAQPEPVMYSSDPEPESEAAEDGPPDALDIARDMVARGQLSQAIQLLMRDAAQQPSGRARFQRRLQIAQLCMGAGQDKVAYPVLDELVKEIDQRRLEEWEAGDMLAPPLALLLRCFDATGNDSARAAVFARLCRIDPSAAMNVSR